MSEKVQRASDEDKVNHDAISQDKLISIMKKFLGSKAADPEVTKWFRVENGLNFMATSIGSAVMLQFKNRWEDTFTKGTGQDFYVKPLPKGKKEETDRIPELETIKDGNKKITKPTGNYIEYPDVKGFFEKFDPEGFYKIELPANDLDNFIAIHEAMEKAAKVGGPYNTAKIDIVNNVLSVRLYDSPLTFSWGYSISSKDYFYMSEYHYDFALMTAVFKSLKDLKIEKVDMYVKDISQPIFFVGRTSEYDYYFAVNRKLVR